LFGSTWFERADLFEMYSKLVGQLSVFGRRENGTLVVRSPLANLDGVRAAPGLVAVVAVLFGSTAFDSFEDSGYWLRFTQSTDLQVSTLNTVVMLGFCAVVGGSFVAATMLSRDDGSAAGVRRSAVPDLFARTRSSRSWWVTSSRTTSRTSWRPVSRP